MRENQLEIISLNYLFLKLMIISDPIIASLSQVHHLLTMNKTNAIKKNTFEISFIKETKNYMRRSTLEVINQFFFQDHNE